VWLTIGFRDSDGDDKITGEEFSGEKSDDESDESHSSASGLEELEDEFEGESENGNELEEECDNLVEDEGRRHACDHGNHPASEKNPEDSDSAREFEVGGFKESSVSFPAMS
jgi:hypothetical protein